MDDLSQLKNIEYLGKGSEGGVIKCSVDGISDELAWKMLFNYGVSTKSMEHYFETVFLSEIRHPNIAFLMHYFFAKPTHEIVTAIVGDDHTNLIQYNAISGTYEYRTSLILVYKCYPSNLKKWMIEKRKDCQMIDIIRICYEISCGVLCLWNHGYVHRDLKLSNILLDYDGHVVINDFGFAIKIDSNGKAHDDHPRGNSAHIAPEVINKFEINRTRSLVEKF